MLNLLICSYNLKVATKMLNYFSINNNGIRIVGIASTKKDYLELKDNSDLTIVIRDKQKGVIDIKGKITGFVVNDDCNIDAVYKKVLAFMNLKTTNDKIKHEVENILSFLGYNLKYQGSRYIVEVVCFMYYNRYEENLERNIYPIIAKKYNKPVYSIKNNIETATSRMLDICTHEKWIDFFYMSTYTGPKSLIMVILKKVIEKYS